MKLVFKIKNFYDLNFTRKLTEKLIKSILTKESIKNINKITVKTLRRKEPLGKCYQGIFFKKNYTIYVAKNLDESRLGIVLAHELTHADQIASGRLKSMYLENYIYYRYKEVKQNEQKEVRLPFNTPYYQQPWEIEAFNNHMVGVLTAQTIKLEEFF